MEGARHPGKYLLFLDGDRTADAPILALDREYSPAVLQGLKPVQRQAHM